MQVTPRVTVARYTPQHSLRLAAALQAAGMLKTYYTGLYAAWDMPPLSALRWMPPWVRHAIQRRLFDQIQRSHPDLDTSRVRVIRPWANMVMAALNRLGVRQPWEMSIFRRQFIFFEHQVASASMCDTDMLVLYDTNAYHALVATQGVPVIRVLDLATVHWAAREGYYRMEAEAWPEYRHRIPSLRHDLPRFQEICSEPELADYVLVPSEFAKSTCVAHGCDEDRICVVPYGVDVNAFCPATGTYQDSVRPFRILFVGSISPLKGFHYLLKALEHLADLSMEVWCCGIDAKTSAGSHASTEDLRIVPLGLVSHEEMPDVMRQVDMLFHPSILDSFSLTCLEAMATGLPVLTTPRTGVAELIRHGENGLVVPYGDVRQMADQVRAMAENETLRKEIGRAARQTALGYTWSLYGDRVERVFREMFGRAQSLDAGSRLLTRPVTALPAT